MSAMRVVILLFAVLAFASCDEKLTGPTTPLNQQFTLAPGETTVIEGADLSVRFNRITGDNRCPADAVCILGGSADVNITASTGGSRRDHVLRTGDMQPVQHEGFTISLIQVEPYPFSARPIDPADYRITLSVTR
jgi:hypothetical protein